MVLSGSERIGWYPTSTLKSKTPYDPKRDVEFYHFADKAPIQIGLSQSIFACFWPQDAHMPQLSRSDLRETVKKVVVKIARDRLSI